MNAAGQSQPQSQPQSEPQPHDARAEGRRHEPDGTRVRRVLAAVAGLALLLAASLLVLWHLQAAWGGLTGDRREDGEVADVAVPAPRSARPAAAPDFAHAAGWLRRGGAQEVLRAARQRLSSYGWVDREASVIHLPVERAIELLLEEGLQVAPPPEAGR